VAGGYRLGAGAALPPLLDDEEAVAVAISLHTATTGSVAGLEETALRALTKLQQMLPSRLRHRISAFHATTVALAGPDSAADRVDPDLLTAIAAACRDQRRLRLRYPGRDAVITREVEPHRLVHTPRRWYLVAWDLGRGDWRTFRVDRIQDLPGAPGARFTPRPLPADDVAAYVSQSIASARTGTRPVSCSARRWRRSRAVPPPPRAGWMQPARTPASCTAGPTRWTSWRCTSGSRASTSRSSTRPSSSVSCGPCPGGCFGPPPRVRYNCARHIRRRTATTLPTMVALSPRIGT
jgi:WYL domain